MSRGARAKFSAGATSNRRGTVLRAIAAARGLSGVDKLVLYTLEAHVGYADRNTGRCWPSVETIASAIGLQERAVRYALVRLHEAGWVQIERRSARGSQITNAYTVTPPAPSEPTEAPEDQADEAAVH